MTARQWVIWLEEPKAFCKRMNSLSSMIKDSTPGQSLKQLRIWEYKPSLPYREYHPRVRLQTMIITLNILSTMKRQIPTLVHKALRSEQTECGIRSKTALLTLLFSSNTEHLPANYVKHIPSVQDLRKEGWFKGQRSQNITRGTGKTLKRRNISINVDRQ